MVTKSEKLKLTNEQVKDLELFERTGELRRVYDGLGNFNGWEDENGRLYPTLQELIDTGWLSKGVKKVRKVV